MEALVQRIRLAMNLILVSSLLVFWGLRADQPDVLAIGKEILDHTRNVLGAFPYVDSHVPRQFMIIYGHENDILGGDDTEAWVRLTPVTDILEMIPSILLPTAEADPTEDEFDKVSRAMESVGPLQRSFAQLERIYNKSGLRAGDTLGNLIDKTKAVVRIPVINEYLEIRTAFNVFAVGAGVVLIYLLSCVVTLQYVAKSERGAKGMDWVFFHRGLLGPIIGSVWLLVPLGVAVQALADGVGSALLTSIWIIVLAVLGGMVIWVSLRARRVALSQSDRSDQS